MKDQQTSNFNDIITCFQKLDGSFFEETVRISLEEELYSNPVAFAIKYKVIMDETTINQLDNHGKMYVVQSPRPSCPATSANVL